MKVHNFLTLTTLVGMLAGPVMADMCKWVDENGTVHYAETCPEGVNGTLVRTAPPPSQEELEQAIRRSEEMLQQRRQRSSTSDQDKAEIMTALREGRSELQAINERCEVAFAEREMLRIDLPVYRDQAGQLHHRDSLHHHSYEGPRTYLENDERATALQTVEKLIDQDCAGIRPAKQSYIYRYLDRPTLDEMLQLLEDMQTYEGPPVSDTCRYARLMLNDLEALKSGIPSDDEREFERRVNQHCD